MLTATLIGMGMGLFPMGALEGPLADSLGLSEDQKSQIREILYQHRQEMVELSAEMKSKTLELQKLFWEGASDSKLKGVLKEISSIRTQMETKRLETALSIRKVLSSQQLAKLREFVQRRRTHMRGPVRARPRGHRGPPTE